MLGFRSSVIIILLQYPGENTYSEFIATHGGSSNAYTGMEDTNFHFDISPDQFKEALEMWAIVLT